MESTSIVVHLFLLFFSKEKIRKKETSTTTTTAKRGNMRYFVKIVFLIHTVFDQIHMQKVRKNKITMNSSMTENYLLRFTTTTTDYCVVTFDKYTIYDHFICI